MEDFITNIKMEMSEAITHTEDQTSPRELERHLQVLKKSCNPQNQGN